MIARPKNPLADHYDDLYRGSGFGDAPAFYEWILRIAQPPMKGRVLDLGCGRGGAMAALGDAGLRGVGLDFSTVALEGSRERTPSLPHVRGDGTRLPFADHSFDTIQLLVGDLESLPCGFGINGAKRKIKRQSMLGKLKERCQARHSPPKLAVCITMYNEEENELRDTLQGVIENYHELRQDKSLNFTKDDMVVVLVCDGFDRLTPTFKQFATDKQFYDEEVLIEKGFMNQDRTGKWVMKDVDELVPVGADVPSNILHLFQVSTWDFDLGEEVPKQHRINFAFALKQRNDGKINSHKWFYQGICQYLNPDLCMMLDIGTRPAKHSVYKLYKYMRKHRSCGGCCGERSAISD